MFVLCVAEDETFYREHKAHCVTLWVLICWHPVATEERRKRWSQFCCLRVLFSKFMTAILSWRAVLSKDKFSLVSSYSPPSRLVFRFSLLLTCFHSPHIPVPIPPPQPWDTSDAELKGKTKRSWPEKLENVPVFPPAGFYVLDTKSIGHENSIAQPKTDKWLSSSISFFIFFFFFTI